MITNCNDVQRILAISRPGEALPPGIDRHLQDCIACREIWHRDAGLWTVLNRFTVPPAPEDLYFKVKERLARRRLRWRITGFARSVYLWNSRSVALLAAILVALGIGAGAKLGGSLANAMATPAHAEARGDALLLDVAPPGSFTAAYFASGVAEAEGR